MPFIRFYTIFSGLSIAVVIIKIDVLRDRCTQLIIIVKMPKIVHLRFQYAPETLHRSIVQALARTGHTLVDADLLHFLSERPAGILNPSVTVDQWPGIRIALKRLIKGLKNQCGIVSAPQ